jgi:hypothetical protein
LTIEAFAKQNNKSKKTVIEWIRKGYIPGANLENNNIPKSARVPYTSARAKNANAIYCSIIKAANQRKHVVPEIYGIGQDEFDGYIRRLKEAGFIELRVSDGITYYDATTNAMKCSRKFILDAIEAGTKGLASGVTEAYLSQKIGV